jgi:hypothetical protein
MEIVSVQGIRASAGRHKAQELNHPLGYFTVYPKLPHNMVSGFHKQASSQTDRKGQKVIFFMA